MGQQLDSMNNKRSDAELLYELVRTGCVEAIRALHKYGVSLEWTDQEGKTPLILACMDLSLVHVAKGLIELGANVNAYRRGPDGGTPLHHAAKRGSEQIVELLLSHRATVLLRNDNHQTPLDVARSEGRTNIVRAMENHICYFSGLMREFWGPWFLEAVTPRLASTYVWVVAVPSSESEEPLKLEIVIYPTQQDSWPRTVIRLWKSKIEEPIFDQCNPKLTIFDNVSGTKYRLASGRQDDKRQLQSLYSACRGIRERIVRKIPSLLMPNLVKPPSVLSHSHTSSLDSSQPTSEASSSAMLSGTSDQSKAINTNGSGSSGDSSSHYGWGTSLGATHSSEVNTNGWLEKPAKDDCNGCGLLNSKPIDQSTKSVQGHHSNSPVVSAASSSSASALSVPSAPLIPVEVSSEGRIHYPSIDSCALDVPVPSMVEASMTNNSMSNAARDPSCAICWDAPIEGACIPCGHMAGCMACLNKIKVNKGACPICMSKMDQVLRLHAV